MWDPLSWLVVGAAAGWVVSLLMGRDYHGGCCGTVIIGMVGAVLGGVVFRWLGGQGATGINLHSIAVAVVGALLLLFLARLARPRRR
jgi:uncharacterized membrane protein YeaQ/YmgE (transglycosylase-associated protein family)